METGGWRYRRNINQRNDKEEKGGAGNAGKSNFSPV
jgi:hypothetical protein